jgi:hypothetical protein
LNRFRPGFAYFSSHPWRWSADVASFSWCPKRFSAPVQRFNDLWISKILPRAAILERHAADTTMRSKMRHKKLATWAAVKVRLDRMDRAGLVGVRDLYQAGELNRRFLHARFVAVAPVLDEYRRLVRAAVFPDPFSQRPIQLRDATTTITEYKRVTGDLAGTVDLMLEFVEAGTEQAADLGYGDEAYFAALERKVKTIVRALDALIESDRRVAMARLIKLGEYQGTIGWGYCDFLGEVAAQVHDREAQSDRTRRRQAG